MPCCWGLLWAADHPLLPLYSLVPVLRKRLACPSLFIHILHKDPPHSPAFLAASLQSSSLPWTLLTLRESSEMACFPRPRLCLSSRCFLRLVFVFGSLLWSCMVPVYSTNIHCPLVKPFFSTSARNSQGNEQKSVGGLIHQSWGKRGVLRGVGC